jgi:hypothetical protein
VDASDALNVKPLNDIVVAPLTATSAILVVPSNKAAVLIAVEPPVVKDIAVKDVARLSASAVAPPSRRVNPFTATELVVVKVLAV